jgi:hypothetical protein
VRALHRGLHIRLHHLLLRGGELRGGRGGRTGKLLLLLLFCGRSGQNSGISSASFRPPIGSLQRRALYERSRSSRRHLERKKKKAHITTNSDTPPSDGQRSY